MPTMTSYWTDLATTGRDCFGLRSVLEFCPEVSSFPARVGASFSLSDYYGEVSSPIFFSTIVAVLEFYHILFAFQIDIEFKL